MTTKPKPKSKPRQTLIQAERERCAMIADWVASSWKRKMENAAAFGDAVGFEHARHRIGVAEFIAEEIRLGK